MSGVGGNSRPSVASRPDPAKAGPAPGLISYSPPRVPIMTQYFGLANSLPFSRLRSTERPRRVPRGELGRGLERGYSLCNPLDTWGIPLHHHSPREVLCIDPVLPRPGF